MAFLEIDDVHKSYGAPRGAQGRHAQRRAARGGLPDRRLRLRQVDAAALRQRAGGDPAAGEIRIEGDTVTGAGVDLNALRRDVGIVFQSYNLFPHMSVLENIMLAPTRVGGVRKE